MAVKIIVAYNADMVIGNKQGKLPWNIPADLQMFKERTVGHVCIMGRKTWESIPEKFRPLPNRLNYVVSSKEIDFPNGSIGVASFRSIEEAIKFSKNHHFDRDIFIIGGAAVYKYCIDHDLVDIVMASEIKGHLNVNAGTHFPNIKEHGWVPSLPYEMGEFNLVEYTKPK